MTDNPHDLKFPYNPALEHTVCCLLQDRHVIQMGHVMTSCLSVILVISAFVKKVPEGLHMVNSVNGCLIWFVFSVALVQQLVLVEWLLTISFSQKFMFN